MNTETNQTTKPSVEELMRPRVIVENLWPGCPFEVGDILINDGDYYWVVGDVGWYSKVDKNEVEPFPYLMRPLPWWEERELGEMPDYIKGVESQRLGANGSQRVLKVKQWHIDCFVGEDDVLYTGMKYLLPATEQDYITYINSHPSKVTGEWEIK